MNHLGDTNKMVETPRTQAVWELFTTGTTLPNDVEFSTLARQLERELNEANDRIKRLEEMYEGVIGEQPELLGSNVMGLLKRELNDTQRRIKRLEEALDTFTCVVELTPMKWNRALQEAFDMARAVLKAKEDKQ